MLETIIGIGGGIASMYSAISAIGSGRFKSLLLAQTKELKAEIIRLNERILYVPNSRPISIDGNDSKVVIATAVREALGLLDQIQRSLGQDIVSSGILPTPERLQEQFNLNPWHCLDGIAPVQHTAFDRSSDWAPIMFTHDGIPFVGWQKKGMLPSVLGLEFDGAVDSWLAAKTTGPVSTPNNRPVISVGDEARPTEPTVKQMAVGSAPAAARLVRTLAGHEGTVWSVGLLARRRPPRQHPHRARARGLLGRFLTGRRPPRFGRLSVVI